MSIKIFGPMKQGGQVRYNPGEGPEFWKDGPAFWEGGFVEIPESLISGAVFRYNDNTEVPIIKRDGKKGAKCPTGTVKVKREVARFDPMPESGTVLYTEGSGKVRKKLFKPNDVIEIPEDAVENSTFHFDTAPGCHQNRNYTIVDLEEEANPTILETIIPWNKDQLEHIEIVQRLCLSLHCLMMDVALSHDRSKFGSDEYETFLRSRRDMNDASHGDDTNYKKWYASNAIQKHVTTNKHHPEYWDKLDEEMPFIEIIIMYFDWLSRSSIKGNGAYWKFRDYNMEKLSKQPHAKVIVKSLEEQFPPDRISWDGEFVRFTLDEEGE